MRPRARRQSKSGVIGRLMSFVGRGSSPDYILAIATAGLVVIGLMAVYSATFDWSYQDYGSSAYVFWLHVRWTLVGILFLAVITVIPYDLWQKAALPLMGIALLLLILVLLLGQEKYGAIRSFSEGSIQPSEFAKLAVVVYIATWLASKGDQIRDFTYGLVPFSILVGVVAGLIVLQPDMSAAALIVLSAIAMFFFAGADLFRLSGGGVVAAFTLFVLVNRVGYAKDRITEHLRTRHDPSLIGYHLRQSLIALGTGGLLGVGPGRGLQKLGYLPAAHTDSIFAVVGEEAGLLGCLLVLGLFALLTYRGFRIATEAPDAFGAILACGLTCTIVFQALANVAVVIGLIPFTGVALPFVSFGGSSMIVSLVGVGILLSISRGRRVAKRSEQNTRYRAGLDRGRRDGGTRLPGAGHRTGASRG
ncbi:MAG: FtsW/RodA/SpoVE family cell cycle protein [Chloroflexi bacterium]|nr:FtsW/RodA/SpoVE family cell cycle protein [Chloroflexota bacterium]